MTETLPVGAYVAASDPTRHRYRRESVSETDPSAHMTPKRIQRQRTKGWRMPEGAIYVGRPTRWGNPWVPSRWNGAAFLTLAASIVQYGQWAKWAWSLDRAMFASLRGHDLACWCPLDQPCHADVLVELANA
jgi:hypothetical protein